MTHVPSWLNEVVRQFASGLGLQTFALNDNGVAALHFENGVVLRLEYAFDFLTLSMSAEPPTTAEALKTLLAKRLLTLDAVLLSRIFKRSSYSNARSRKSSRMIAFCPR